MKLLIDSLRIHSLCNWSFRTIEFHYDVSHHRLLSMKTQNML